MISIPYVLGVIVGGVVGVFVVALILFLVKKTGGKVDYRCKEGYDERQKIARGKAAFVAMFVCLFYYLGTGALKYWFDVRFFDSMSGVILGMWITIAVFLGISIMEDAYMNRAENPKGIIIVLLGIGLMNMCVAVASLISGKSLLVNGALSNSSMNLQCGIFLILIVTLFAGKLMYDKKTEDE